MLIEPMADMEVDRLAVQGRHLVARCGGGQAMMVFKYTDGAEELEEEDFIECEDLFGDGDENSDGSKLVGFSLISKLLCIIFFLTEAAATSSCIARCLRLRHRTCSLAF